MIKVEHLTEEPENDNPDRCDVCKIRLTASQTCKTESQSTRRTTRRNPSRSAKRNVVYRENDYSLYNINQHCWKCSEVQPINVKTETLTMEDQSEPPSAGHLQSDILGKLSTKRFNCDKTFTKNSSLKVHVRTVHDKIRAFPCPHCPYKAAHRSSLQNHILTHTGEKNFKCDICDKKFSRNGDLKVHISTVHDKIKQFECPHCPYKAGVRGYLKSHILTHTGERNFKCDICDKKFIQNGHLKLHISTVHDKIKPFECPHCPYKAGERGTLKSHILTHTGEKNFKCDICDKKFTTGSYLKLHISTVHDKVKAFPCPHCPYEATYSGNLKLHIRTVHDKVKPFPCPHCPYEAARRAHLQSHILNNHGSCDMPEKMI